MPSGIFLAGYDWSLIYSGVLLSNVPPSPEEPREARHICICAATFPNSACVWIGVSCSTFSQLYSGALDGIVVKVMP